jgi:hypothetical protein
MDDIKLNLIMLVIFLLLGGGIFLLVRRGQAVNEEKINQIAAERGWTDESIREPLAWGLRLKSKKWTFEAISRSSGQEVAPGSSDVSMQTTWHAEIPGSPLFIGPRTSQANLGAVGDSLTRQVLRLAIGPGADSLVEVQAGHAAFRQKYMVWAQDPVAAKTLLTPALESALVDWKGTPPLIKWTAAGLTIELRGVRLKKAADIVNLVQLGELFLATVMVE